MDILKKILVAIVSLLVALALVIALFFGMITQKTNDAVAAQVNADIDMQLVQDGTYAGAADGGMVQVEVEVTVRNHEITSIVLLKHENGKGQAAEAILDEMIRQNTDNVDMVSGATISSKTIRSAVNCALQKGNSQ